MKSNNRFQLTLDNDDTKSLAELMWLVEKHTADCRCAICCQLAEDVRVDVLLKHPELGNIAHRFVERRFPF